MRISDYISLAAFIVSLAAIIISYVTSTKKYELQSSLRREIIHWHRETVELLIFVREYLDAGVSFDKAAQLAKLSALIEEGRFYFPNIIEGKEGLGAHKPSAYRGAREITLEFLILSYNIIKREDAGNYFNHLLRLQRLFTARIFDVLAPRDYYRKAQQFTSIPLREGITTGEFIRSNPELFSANSFADVKWQGRYK